MAHAFSEFIKIIGKGKKGSRSLTREEARDAMAMVLDGEVTGEQRGAFLMLLRTREETPEEITGFLQACRERIPLALTTLPVTLDIGCYAGKRRQLPWYLLAVAVLAQAGHRVLLHGAHEPGSGRLYASHVLPALGLDPVQTVAEAGDQLQQVGASYLDLGVILPPLDEIIKLREWFGLRSCANTLARLLNPSQAGYAIQGVYHMHLDHKHCRVNEQFPEFDALCFRGDGGDPEVNGERPTELFITRQATTVTTELPALAPRWALKDKTMQVEDLLSYWRGESEHAYGEYAVTGTLASFLMLVENLPVNDAVLQAQSLWKTRNSECSPFSPLSEF